MLLVVFSLAFWSCSQTPNIVEPDEEFTINMDNFNQFVRPEFIDNRSEAEIEQFTKQASNEYIYRKKKPTNPGGGGGDDPVDPNPNPPNKYAYMTLLINTIFQDIFFSSKQ
ncbi:MAG: hypothetical protein K8S23_07760, partial [Candidatus Cloacimonetes bacterium]|nr:hypothetical protein [Candidatus Cloacimonadota bacterium]